MQYSVVKLKSLFFENRLNPETYHPEKLNFLSKLRNINHSTLGKYFKKISKAYTPYNLRKLGYIKLLELENISSFKIKDIPITDSKTVYSNKYSTKPNDVIISRLRPYLKQVDIIQERDVYVTTELVVLRQKNELISSEYLYIFLSINYVQKILYWSQEGTNHPRVPFFVIEDLPIPIFPLLSKNIQSIVSSTQKLDKQSKILYEETEELLLEELGLKDWKPKHQLSFVRNFSDTQKAQRLDAEYFQPKYDEIVEIIKSYKGGWSKLKALVKIADKNYKADPSKEYSYIELADIGMNGEVIKYQPLLGNVLPSRAKRKVSFGNVIASSVEGSLSSIALIQDSNENNVCSNGFYVLSSEIINSETLLILLKVIACQYQLKHGCSGTILTAISRSELEKMILPKIQPAIQQEIAKKVRESHRLREESKRLLEVAKQAVEMAIEQNEEVATQWLEKNTSKKL